MDTFLGFVEDSDLSMWIRGDSMLAFPTHHHVHTICMGTLARASAVIDMRILGMAPGADAPMRIKLIAGTSLAMWVGVLILPPDAHVVPATFFADQPDALPAI